MSISVSEERDRAVDATATGHATANATGHVTGFGWRLGRGAALLCLLLAAGAHPQNLISQIGWKGAGPGIVIGLAVFFVTGLVLLLSFYAGSSRKRSKDRQDMSDKLFYDGCQRRGITAEEARTLRAVAACAPGAAKPHEIFDSIALFERCMDTYVNRAIRAQRAEGQDAFLHDLRGKLGYNFLPTEQPMTSTRNVSVGQRVSIHAPGPNAHPMAGEVTRVGEVSFTARVADEFREDLNVAEGAEITVAFLRQGDAAYSVSVRVQKTSGAGDISFFHTVKFLRNQNRRYMRLDISLPLKYSVAEKANQKEKAASDTYQARSADISGGGLCFLASEPLAAGDVIMLTIQLPGQALGNIKSKILKVIPIEGKGSAQYKHLTQFVTIEPQQRERIVKMIFEKQREAIQMR